MPNPSKPKNIDAFLSVLKKQSPQIFNILNKARKLVHKQYPSVVERIMYGGVMFSLGEDDVGGLFPYTKHVSFEFSKGVNMKDPNGYLEGSGKGRRHVKLSSVDDIKDKELLRFAKQLKKQLKD